MQTRTVGEVGVLTFDCECRPLSYWYDDATTAEITAIAASWGADEPVKCWLLGRDDPRQMHEEFEALYREADILTGHYIRKFDLPLINGARFELGMSPLPTAYTCDTKLDLMPFKHLPQSQETLSDMLGIAEPKVQMSQKKWRAANRLTPYGLEQTEARVVGDVRQHQAMRAELLRLGMLRAPRRWAVGFS